MENRLKKNFRLLCMVMACTSFPMWQSHAHPEFTLLQVVQQTNAVRGTVKDTYGEPIIGASIVAKGSGNGCITDIDGNFVLSNVPEGTVLQISFIGYQNNNLYNPQIRGRAAQVIGEKLFRPIPQAAIDANELLTAEDQNPGY